MAEKRETIRLMPDDLGQPIEVELNTSYRLILQEEEPPVGTLNLLIFNYVDKMPLEDVQYELDGGGNKLAGRTRKGGAIVRTQVPAGVYELSIGSHRYTVATDTERDRPHVVYVVMDPPSPGGASDEIAVETEDPSDEDMSDVVVGDEPEQDEAEEDEPEQDDG